MTVLPKSQPSKKAIPASRQSAHHQSTLARDRPIVIHYTAPAEAGTAEGDAGRRPLPPIIEPAVSTSRHVHFPFGEQLLQHWLSLLHVAPAGRLHIPAWVVPAAQH